MTDCPVQRSSGVKLLLENAVCMSDSFAITARVDFLTGKAVVFVQHRKQPSAVSMRRTVLSAQQTLTVPTELLSVFAKYAVRAVKGLKYG